MTKAMITIGYNEYVMELEDAVLLAKVLTTAKLHEVKWRKEEDGGSTHHIFRKEGKAKNTTITILDEDYYNMACLAGPPPKS